MTAQVPLYSPDPDVELELIQWRQARFERITECVEDALPSLVAKIESTVASMSSIAVGKAQISSDGLWRMLFEPWAREVASQIEAEMEEEIGALAASLSEKATNRGAMLAALPALARVGVLAASLAAIPSVISIATVTTTSFFFFTTPAISWPILALGGAGLAVASFTGNRVVDRLNTRNRAHLVVRLVRRARITALGYGLVSGERCLVTDLQAATLRRLEAKLEAA